MFDELKISSPTRDDYNKEKENISEDALVLLEDEEKLITPYKEYQFVPSGIDLNEMKKNRESDLAKITEIQGKLNGVGNISEELDKKADKTTVEGIEAKIPSQATATNQLADKDFVNSSISTNTAEFKGTHDSLEELKKQTADANDYGFVVGKDSDGNTVYNRYKYVEGTGWVFEYALNNSSFTAAQWASIQSGITSGDVELLKRLPTRNEFDSLSGLVDTLNEGVGHLNEDIKAVTDGCFIAYHRKSDGSQYAVPYWSWPALEERGEVADGVLVLIDGQAPIIVSPTGTQMYWSKNAIAVDASVGGDFAKAYVDYSGKTRTAAIMAKGEELFGEEEETWKDNYAPAWCNAYNRSHDKGDGTMIGLGAGSWWLPSIAELIQIWKRKYAINVCLSVISGASQLVEAGHWSSTEVSSANAWDLNLSNGNLTNWRAKVLNSLSVRAVSAYRGGVFIPNASKEDLKGYLPLTGGTMANTTVVKNLNAEQWEGLRVPPKDGKTYAICDGALVEIIPAGYQVQVQKEANAATLEADGTFKIPLTGAAEPISEEPEAEDAEFSEITPANSNTSVERAKNLTVEAGKQYYNDKTNRTVTEYEGFSKDNPTATILSSEPLTFKGDFVLSPSTTPTGDYILYTLRYFQTSDIKFIITVTAEGLNSPENGLKGKDI